MYRKSLCTLENAPYLFYFPLTLFSSSTFIFPPEKNGEKFGANRRLKWFFAILFLSFPFTLRCAKKKMQISSSPYLFHAFPEILPLREELQYSFLHTEIFFIYLHTKNFFFQLRMTFSIHFFASCGEFYAKNFLPFLLDFFYVINIYLQNFLSIN